VLVLGALGTLAMGTDSSNLYVATVGFVLGIGMGFVGYTTIALVQDSVEWSMRGSATASNIFSRSLGSALGASVLGAILNFGLHRYADPASEAHLHAVLNSATGLHEVANSPVWQAVFNQSLHLVFWGVLVFSALCFAATYLIPADQVADQRRAPATR
jgi:MFS family permease